MKVLLFTIYNLLFCLSIVHAQSYEYMYKKQPANDSIINIKTYDNQHLNAYADSTDTSRVIGFAIAPLYKSSPKARLEI